MSVVQWWGGAECTINRVGNRYFNQLVRTGHADRLDDLDRIASLGIQAVRFPILWEHHWKGDGSYDFRWADARMARLRELNIDVVVGLVHHGSGPDHTDLLSDSFVSGLAEFAAQVARRYPWVTYFTPVNEPLTTARFSGLYGHWYPHARDDVSFARALLVETLATRQAMAAIRRVTPHAKLVQTEDIGTVFSTPKLRYQADFENHRRWLSLDLLFGHVRPGHAMYPYLTEVGQVAPALLQSLVSAPCPPDIIGLNYYVTSDRFLDDRTTMYPASVIGSNGRDTYADVEAVRVLEDGIVGHRGIIEAVWQRYNSPLALTEVHLGCSEEHQAAWLTEAWTAALQAAAEGVDVRAVTAWSLFGAFDWNSLVTKYSDHYEPGAFDVRHDPPRATLLAETIRRLARQSSERNTALGWWRAPERILYASFSESKTSSGNLAAL